LSRQPPLRPKVSRAAAPTAAIIRRAFISMPSTSSHLIGPPVDDGAQHDVRTIRVLCGRGTPGADKPRARQHNSKQGHPMKKSATSKDESPSWLIDARINELDDWRGKTLAHVRALIKQAEPEVVEEWKWSVPVWSHDGLICTGETYKSAVKLTFAKGAALEDPTGLFNSSLEGNVRRAIDLHEGDAMDEDAFKTLIRAAAALNRSTRK